MEDCYWKHDGTEGFTVDAIGRFSEPSSITTNLFSFGVAPGSFDIAHPDSMTTNLVDVLNKYVAVHPMFEHAMMWQEGQKGYSLTYFTEPRFWTLTDSPDGYPIMTTKTHTASGVPYHWLYDYYTGFALNEDYENKANEMGANGMKVYGSYITGCNPTHSGSKFRITAIEKDDTNRVTLKWSPHLTNRTYTVWGKTNLTDTAWHSPTNSGTRFFKVTAGM